jgi:hypothetical protein
MLSHTRLEQDRKYEKVMEFIKNYVDKLQGFQKIAEDSFPEVSRISYVACDMAKDSRRCL